MWLVVVQIEITLYTLQSDQDLEVLLYDLRYTIFVDHVAKYFLWCKETGTGQKPLRTKTPSPIFVTWTKTPLGVLQPGQKPLHGFCKLDKNPFADLQAGQNPLQVFCNMDKNPFIFSFN